MQAVCESQQTKKKKNKKRQIDAFKHKDVSPGEEDISSGKKMPALIEAMFDLKTDPDKDSPVSELVCSPQERKRKNQKKRQGNALAKNYVNPSGQEDSSSSKGMLFKTLENKDVHPGCDEDISSSKKPFITEAVTNMGPEADSEKFHLDSESIYPSEERKSKKWKKRQEDALRNNDVNHSGQEDIYSIMTTSLDIDLKTESGKAKVESKPIHPREEGRRKKQRKNQENSLGNCDINHGTQKDTSSAGPVINAGPKTLSEMAQCGPKSSPQEEKKKIKKKKKKKHRNVVINNDMDHCREEDTSSIKLTCPVTEVGIDIELKSSSEKACQNLDLIHPAEDRKRKKQKKRGNALGNEDVNHGGQADTSSIQITCRVTDVAINIGTEPGSEIAYLDLCDPSREKTGKKRKKRQGSSLENSDMNHGAQEDASLIKINPLVTGNIGSSFELEMIHFDMEPSHLQEERKRKKGKKRKGNSLGSNEITHVTQKDTSLIDTTFLIKEDVIDTGPKLSNPPESTGKKKKKRSENAPGSNDVNHCIKEDPSSVIITPLVMEDSIDTGRRTDSEMGHPEPSHPLEGGKRRKRKKNGCNALKNDDKENVPQEENFPVDVYSHKPSLECSDPQILELNTSSASCAEKNEEEHWSNQHDSSKNNEANCDGKNDKKSVLKVAGWESTSMREDSLFSHEVGSPKHLSSSQQDDDAEVDQILPDTQNVETNQRKKKTIRTSHREREMFSNFSVSGSKATEEQDLAQTSQDHSYRRHVAVISGIKLDTILEGRHATSAQISECILPKKCTVNGSESELTPKEGEDRLEMNPEKAISRESTMEDVSGSNMYTECIEDRNNGNLAKVLIPVQNKYEKDVNCNKCLIDCKRSCDDLADHDFQKNNAVKETRMEEGIPSLSSLDVAKESDDPNDAEIQSNIPQIMHSLSERACSNNSKKKLLVLDLNGLLADIVPYVSYGYIPHARVSGKAVFKRPFCDDFLAFCFKRFDVGIWSSRMKKNVDSLVQILFGDLQHKLLFCWDASHCTRTGFQTIENKDKPLVLKELKILWEYLGHAHSLVNQEYNESNTLLVDDSPYKALRNPAHTAVFPCSYQYKDVGDSSLGPEGDLRLYLERVAVAENVQKFVEQNPFGQHAITESNQSWNFYSKILRTS